MWWPNLDLLELVVLGRTFRKIENIYRFRLRRKINSRKSREDAYGGDLNGFVAEENETIKPEIGVQTSRYERELRRQEALTQFGYR
jgi:hypothetical protein